MVLLKIKIILLNLANSNVFKGRGGLVVGYRLWGRRVTDSRPNFNEDPPLLHAKSYVMAKRPLVDVTWKFGEGVPARVSFSSSDRGSKSGGESQNSPRATSKRDVNITKPN
ncbi:hypothetical protein AVEN_121257-1 [Araneus ventricosus]|uniref:Uncharacterized protein n=1 Tax=Araneus ventricosus TaxID=182803 RepID=A0A4Y2NAC4_ARAVE|nr:hypothetical protein AVEN_261966-1 [Araneus ventricosus]GBN36341.1 hypothetical protein AVEN_272017-1 [Araneus ventricosus]GBN36360.1 hypothetical protein AVEN_66654-1 [Araneus ventricosus]GBN36367.1 hypothetical protein AVEN_76970-1 [Araneus ventricosus]GBN36374.1 hypothetical protein AVEN_94115-1 [Araneus ventricosus]